jgi:anthranilate/para-aminobenzoate synthase component I
LAERETDIPDVMFGLYDTAVTYDHLERTAWVTSFGLKEDGTADNDLAKVRANALAEELTLAAKRGERFFGPIQGVHPVVSALTKDGFISGFNMMKGSFNLPIFSQQFRTPTHRDPWDVYLDLRGENPTAFAGYINCGGLHILSASRTCLIKVGQERVALRPTKGSRPRGATAEDDRKRVNELKFDEEVQASHRNLVSDVVRDISRACPAETIEISDVAGVETDKRAHHLVTEISAAKRAGATGLDCLLSVIPAFSDGGAAPVVSRLEGARRDVYTGTIGFIGCNGTAEFNFAFRTMIIKDTISSLHAGAEVSRASDAEEAFVNIKKAAGHILELVR